jgi:hypothetical protein
VDEKEIDSGVSKTLVDTIDTETAPQALEHGNLDGPENVQGWESTMVDSLLKKHRPGSSWMKKRRRTGPRECATVSSRWSVIVHDWPSLDRPASVY